MHIGKQLRAIRQEHGFSTRKLALLMNDHQTTVIRLERNKDSNTKILRRVAAAYGIPFHRFLSLLSWEN